MGRPRKPTRLKVLEGDRPDRIPTGEPLPSDGEVVAPGWLDDVALEVWGDLAPDLIAKGVLTAWDVEAFAMACDAVAQYREARALVHAEGVTVTGAMGGQVRNPAAQVMRDAAAQFAQLAGRFGLTPADRAKLDVGRSSDGPKGADLLSS